LMTVQGVGAKVALAILGILTGDEIGDAILMEDRTSVQRAPGVGKRVAERIVSELKSKVPSLGVDLPAAAAASPKGATPEAATGHSAAIKDAVSALINLGYPEAQVRPILTRLVQASEEEPDVSTLIRKGLQKLAG